MNAMCMRALDGSPKPGASQHPGKMRNAQTCHFSRNLRDVCGRDQRPHGFEGKQYSQVLDRLLPYLIKARAVVTLRNSHDLSLCHERY
jgi:hypothetical protein